jgi:hypothetical protein
MNRLYNDLVGEVIRLCKLSDLNNLYKLDKYNTLIDRHIKRKKLTYMFCHYNLSYLTKYYDKYKKNKIEFNNVLRCGNIECIKYVFNRIPKDINNKEALKYMGKGISIDIAIESNSSIEIIEWLFINNFFTPCHPILNQIIKIQNINLIMWFIDKLSSDNFKIFNEITWKSVIYTNNINLIRLVFNSNMSYYKCKNLMYYAIDQNNMDIILLLYQQKRYWDRHIVDIAIDRGNIKVLEWFKMIYCPYCAQKIVTTCKLVTIKCTHQINIMKDHRIKLNGDCKCYSKEYDYNHIYNYNYYHLCYKYYHWRNAFMHALKKTVPNLNVIKWLYYNKCDYDAVKVTDWYLTNKTQESQLFKDIIEWIETTNLINKLE